MNINAMIEQRRGELEKVCRQATGIDDKRRKLWVLADIEGKNVDGALERLSDDERKLSDSKRHLEAVLEELQRRRDTQRGAELAKRHEQNCAQMQQLNREAVALEKLYAKAAREFFASIAALSEHTVWQEKLASEMNTYCKSNPNAKYIEPRFSPDSVGVSFNDADSYKEGHRFDSLAVNVGVSGTAGRVNVTERSIHHAKRAASQFS